MSLYRWLVFAHFVGVFGFLLSHGVSVGVALILRAERDPARITALLELSGRSVGWFYNALGLLVVSGVAAGFLGDWWGHGWIWGGILTLVVVSLAMRWMARPYYRRVGFVARALAEGTEAVTAEQFDGILRSRRPMTVLVIGFGGLLLILYLMMFKPSLGLQPSAAPGPTVTPTEDGAVAIAADQLSFDRDVLEVPAGQSFDLAFENRSSIPHNVAVYTDEAADEALFVGEVFAGPRVVTEVVPALDPGSYFFRCDVHPTQMTGTVEAG